MSMAGLPPSAPPLVVAPARGRGCHRGRPALARSRRREPPPAAAPPLRRPSEPLAAKGRPPAGPPSPFAHAREHFSRLLHRPGGGGRRRRRVLAERAAVSRATAELAPPPSGRLPHEACACWPGGGGCRRPCVLAGRAAVSRAAAEA
ncbi:unnamed protein product [Urochloa humidicola]